MKKEYQSKFKLDQIQFTNFINLLLNNSSETDNYYLTFNGWKKKITILVRTVK